MEKESENMEKEKPAQKIPCLISDTADCTSWDEWLEKTEEKLKELKYRRWVQNFKEEDFAYWKTFRVDGKKAYQVGVLFYDFRKYPQLDEAVQRIGIQFYCMMIDSDDRIDLTVSKDISLEEFEVMAKTFYDSMNHFSNKCEDEEESEET